MSFKKTTTALHSGAVVGTIHSEGSLAAALRLRKGSVDFLELRVDAFARNRTGGSGEDRLEAAAARLRAPLIVTARHPKEGGAHSLSVAERRALFRQFLSHAALIDVELRSAAALAGTLEEARERGVGIILSHHDFRTTPSLERLRELASRASEIGCTVFKVATVARTAAAFSVLLQFLAESRVSQKSGPHLSVMGMGEFGKISRLALGRSGSVLNYGYLDKLQVPGQWPVELLRQRLLELGS